MKASKDPELKALEVIIKKASKAANEAEKAIGKFSKNNLSDYSAPELQSLRDLIENIDVIDLEEELESLGSDIDDEFGRREDTITIVKLKNGKLVQRTFREKLSAGETLIGEIEDAD